MVEEARLEIVCVLTRTRGFESLPLRHLASRTTKDGEPIYGQSCHTDGRLEYDTITYAKFGGHRGLSSRQIAVNPARPGREQR